MARAGCNHFTTSVSPLRIDVTPFDPRLNQRSNKRKRFRAEQPHLRFSELPVTGDQGIDNPNPTSKGLPFTSLPVIIKETSCLCQWITSRRGGTSTASKGYEKGRG